jgi:hypothetical protein
VTDGGFSAAGAHRRNLGIWPGGSRRTRAGCGRVAPSKGAPAAASELLGELPERILTGDALTQDLGGELVVVHGRRR